MTSRQRKIVAIIGKYIEASFTENDWHSLGQITGELKAITEHPRLLRSLDFGDRDYEQCISEVLEYIFKSNSELINEVVDFFDIDLWYQQKEPEKYKRIFSEESISIAADFWKKNHLKMFVSHLSSNKIRMTHLKNALASWGVSAFIAHEDIEPSREWMSEVEAGLETMDVLVAVVEPGFKESDWCAQEVGFALGRKIEVIPLRAGLDPFGFFGKIQGIQVKNKRSEEVSRELVQLLLKKPKFRPQLLEGMSSAFSMLSSDRKVQNIQTLDEWSIATDDQVKSLIEASSLSALEKKSLRNIIARVKAFERSKPSIDVDLGDLDVPF